MSTENPYVEPQFPPITSPPTRSANKRKRAPSDNPATRASPMTRRNKFQNNDDPSMAPTASMDQQTAQHFLEDSGQYGLPGLAPSTNQGGNDGEGESMDTAARALNYTIQVPSNGPDTFIAETGTGQAEASNYPNTAETTQPFDQIEVSPPPTAARAEESPSDDPNKPSVGSAEWQRQRKDNHKEVERRRRETINEGINELQKIVPNCEKNKGSILQRTIAYIAELHDKLGQNIDKWTFEKLVTDQAIADLSGKLHRSWLEKEEWKRIAKEAGVDVDNVELNIQGIEGEEDGGEKEKAPDDGLAGDV